MATKNEVLEAKQILSARLLATGIRHRVLSRHTTMRLREAVPNLSANVHAVGMGRKLVDGKTTDTLAVRLYVVQKLAASAIPPRDLLPETLDGVPCDVIETPPAFAGVRQITRARRAPRSVPRVRRTPSASAASCSTDRQKRQRPFPAGISVAHRDVTAGTIGYFCRSIHPGDAPDDVFVLSNNHVLADVNNAAIGDPILQPGPADDGTGADQVADLHRFIRIRLGGDVANRVDAAIGRVHTGVTAAITMCSIGAITGTERGVEDMRVRKHGRTTGLTEGTITDESVDSLVGMDHNDPNVVGLFTGQLRIERAGQSAVFGLGGDSGSLVVAKDSPRAVGLYFAGPDSGVYGLANQIADVLKELEIQLIV
jgi:hypothetical protein